MVNQSGPDKFVIVVIVSAGADLGPGLRSIRSRVSHGAVTPALNHDQEKQNTLTYLLHFIGQLHIETTNWKGTRKQF